MLQKFFKNKNISKKLKLGLKNTKIHKTLGHQQREIESKLNTFESKVYRRILGPVYDNEKENWRILTNKELYASVKKLL